MYITKTNWNNIITKSKYINLVVIYEIFVLCKKNTLGELWLYRQKP